MFPGKCLCMPEALGHAGFMVNAHFVMGLGTQEGLESSYGQSH